MALIPGLGRSAAGGHGNPLQYSCLEKPMDGGAWRAAVYGVTKSQTGMKQLSTRTRVPDTPSTACVCQEGHKLCVNLIAGIHILFLSFLRLTIRSKLLNPL